MKIKTSELTRVALDWAVAQAKQPKEEGSVVICDGIVQLVIPKFGKVRYAPSENWFQGGPIIEREFIGIEPASGYRPVGVGGWLARRPCRLLGDQYPQTGPTPLVAAMRCYVASKLGEEVDVPEELLT